MIFYGVCIGEIILVVNVVLLNFLMLVSFVFDGIVYVSEVKVGKVKGEYSVK